MSKMSKKKWLTQSVSESVSDKVTYWAVRWQLKRPKAKGDLNGQKVSSEVVLGTVVYYQVAAKRDIRPNDGFLVQLARLHLSLNKKWSNIVIRET